MPILKRSFILWLCISFFYMQLLYMHSNAVAGVTTKEVQTVSSPDVKIPTETVPSSEKEGGSWIWAILGAVLVGGAIAAIGGGGDSGGDDDDDDGGSAAISW